MQRSIFLFIVMVVFFFGIITPKSFAKFSNEILHTKLLSGFSSKSEDTSYKKYFFSFGIGYQYFSWDYDLSHRDKSGALTVIHQGSQYHGMNLNAKFTAFRPWGFLTTINIYFPFSTTESVYFSQNKTHAKTRIIKDGIYLLKNIPPSNTLKGIGITTAAGVHYSFEKESHSANIGLGFSWVVFAEDLYEKDRQSRTASMFGFMLDSEYQFRFSKIAGISLGTKLAYYPIALFSINNIIGDYSIKSTSMLELSLTIAPVFYF